MFYIRTHRISQFLHLTCITFKCKLFKKKQNLDDGDREEAIRYHHVLMQATLHCTPDAWEYQNIVARLVLAWYCIYVSD